jgi:hypothetical protein
MGVDDRVIKNEPRICVYPSFCFLKNKEPSIVYFVTCLLSD